MMIHSEDVGSGKSGEATLKATDGGAVAGGGI